MTNDRPIPASALAACPAVPAVLWFGVGLLPVLGPAVLGAGWILPLAIAGVLAAALWVTCPAASRPSACLAGVGVVLALAHVHAPWATYRRHLPRDECSAQIRARVLSTHYSGDTLAWLRPPALVPARITDLRLAPGLPWNPCRGKILIRGAAARGASYGATVQAEGAFLVPEDHLAGGFSYKKHLRLNGISHIFEVQALDIVAPPAATAIPFAALQVFRDRCAEALVAHIRSRDRARVLLAMCLGYRQGLTPNARRRFLRSGTVHLFAISGLHVGIVASIMLLALRVAAVPFRLRYLLVPPLLALYVALTGGAPSAVRAWLMLTVWYINKGLFRPAVPLNAVAGAALILLAWNPLNLFQTGFQFSFLIVLVLILGWRAVSAVVTAVNERDRWLPVRARRHKRSRIVYSTLQITGGGGLAWLGSAGLVAWTNSLVIPAGLMVNAAVSLLAYLTLLFAFPKALVGLCRVAWADVLLARLLEPLLATIQFTAKTASTTPCSFAVPRPSTWLVIVYYLALIGVLAPRVTSRWRLAAAVVLTSALAAICLIPRRTPETVVFFGGQTTTPSVLICGDDTLPPLLINTGGPRMARTVTSWMQENGIATLDCVVLPGSNWATTAGTDILLDALTVNTLVLPEPPHPHASLQQAQHTQGETGGRIRTLTSSRTAHSRTMACSANEWQFVTSRSAGVTNVEASRAFPDRGRYTVRITTRDTGPATITTQWDGQEPQHTRLTPTLIPQIVTLPSPRNAPGSHVSGPASQTAPGPSRGQTPCPSPGA